MADHTTKYSIKSITVNVDNGSSLISYKCAVHDASALGACMSKSNQRLNDFDIFTERHTCISDVRTRHHGIFLFSL